MFGNIKRLIMTPKEKAEELFTTYRFSLSIPNAPLGDLKDSIAKQCALIAVDEILNNDVGYNAYDGVIGNNIWIDIEYWQEVKQEIENYGNNN
jgi:hypothetical protein